MSAETATVSTIAGAVLERPILLRGHGGQILGAVRRVHFCLKTRQVALVELASEERVIQLNGESLVFDNDAGCFHLQRRRACADASRRGSA